MSIFEYNKDEEEKKLRKAEFEAGLEEGGWNRRRTKGCYRKIEQINKFKENFPKENQ